MDWHLIPLLAVMYMVKTVNFTNGTSRNILVELGISSDAYALRKTTPHDFIPYILAETPSNLVVKFFKPSVWQARIMISRGVVLCCHLAVKNPAGLSTVRAFLGLFEAGRWPGILLQLCYWYRPDRLAPRIVWATGLLAFRFNSVTAGGLSVPADASWLSEKEKAFVQARPPINSPRAAEKDFNWKGFMDTRKDKKLWLFQLCWAFYTTGTTGLIFYQPTVIANLGFTTIAQAQLLNIPPAIFACVLTTIFGIFADTGCIPQPSIPLFFMVVILACYVVEYTYPNTGGVYAATFLAGGFSTAWYTRMWPWRVQTAEGATGSAFAIALANSYGQIGGAALRYTTLFGIAMGFIGAAIIMNLITWYVTSQVGIDTRKIKRARIAALKPNQAVLDDVDIHAGENRTNRTSGADPVLERDGLSRYREVHDRKTRHKSGGHGRFAWSD
ncbi:putative pantothenate transporter [Podospora didyma]|uniref:Pantothenate transporter n=1 Tax=Podospora didyma TaxID=330526 RepID=A0AAE0U3K2_9PEZI|nr:putative pantothenate transporter [Podospora didyma]